MADTLQGHGQSVRDLLQRGRDVPVEVEVARGEDLEQSDNPTVICPCCQTERSADMVRQIGTRWVCGNGQRRIRRGG